MGEAHQAVSYSELIKQEHTEANHDKEVLQLVLRSGLKSWKKKMSHIKRKVRNSVYPAHLETLWISIAIVTALHFASQKVPFDLVNVVIKNFPE